MSRQISDLFIDSFDAEVKAAYQGSKSLRETVRVKTGVVGSSHRFPVFGKGVATRHIAGNDVLAMNLGNSKATAQLENWGAFDYSDVYDLAKINFNERQEIANATAKAIGRREDQLIIDVLAGGSTEIGGTTTAFDVALIAEASKELSENNVEGEDRFIVFSPNQKQQLLNTTQATSSDYNSVKTLVAGDVNSFYGFTFKEIGTRSEGGLPIPASDQRYAYAYHKQAVGLAVGIEMKAAVDWIAEKRAWLIGCDYSAGAVLIDDEGIVKILSKEI